MRFLTTEPALLERQPAPWSCCRATCRSCRRIPLENAGRAPRRRRAPPPPWSRPSSTTRRAYGRIVRSGEQIARIVEEKDASPAEREIREINSGIYAFALDGLFDAVRSIAAENAQREYYLPDLVAIYAREACGVETITFPNADEIRGINSRVELAAVSRIVRQKRRTRRLMAAGVTIEDPATTYIDGGRGRSAPTPSFIPACRSRGARRSAPAARFTAACASSTPGSAIASPSSTTA